MPALVAIVDVSAHQSIGGDVLLRDFLQGAMQSGLLDGPDAALVGERGIYLAIREEGGEVETFQQGIGGSCSLQIIGRRPGGMNPDAVGGASQGGKHREFAEAEIVVEYQSQAFVQAISAQGDVLPAPQFPYLQIEGVEIIAQVVLAGAKGFARILRPHNAQLYIVAIPELIAQPMLVFIAHIAIGIALSFIERHLQHAHRLMLSIFDDIPDIGEICLLLVSIYIEEMLHQLSLIPADARNQGEFRHAFHSAIAINVSLDVFHLR